MDLKTDITRRQFLHTSTIAGGALMLSSTAAGTTIDMLASRVVNRPSSTAETLRICPIIVKRTPNTVGIVQQFPFSPLAYFEKETGKVYVDNDHRDEVIWMLKGQVNGKGIWTFDTRDNLMPPQAREVPYANWNKNSSPQIGDFRIINRSVVNVKWEFNNLPIYDSDPPMWSNAASIVHGQCVGRELRLGKEVYRRVGACNVYADPDCTQLIGTFDVENWTASG